MLSTIHRRHILDTLSHNKTLSLKSLKETYVDSGEMNQTTLYRILEKFLSEGIIHKAEFGGEKFFTLCKCKKSSEEAIKLKCCIGCNSIEDKHSPLPPESLSSETIELVKSCKLCNKKTSLQKSQ